MDFPPGLLPVGAMIDLEADDYLLESGRTPGAPVKLRVVEAYALQDWRDWAWLVGYEVRQSGQESTARRAVWVLLAAVDRWKATAIREQCGG